MRKTKRGFRRALGAWCVALGLGLWCATLGATEASGETASARFAHPPRSARVQTWWHWIGGGVTREGITRDLEAMRDGGISRAYVFTPAGETPVPKLKCLSKEWMAAFDHALAEAKRCGVELGVHNCPGQSSSGGPWIEPADSMKFLVATEASMRSGERMRLPRPLSNFGFYHDIAVVAFPALFEEPPVTGGGKRLLQTPKVGDSCVIEVSYAKPRPARMLLLTFAEEFLSYSGEVEASGDRQAWTSVGTFRLVKYRTQPTPKPIILSNVPRDARHFRVRLTCCDSYPWIKKGCKTLLDIAFTEMPRLPDVDAYNSSYKQIGFAPELCALDGAHGVRPDQVVNVTAMLRPDGTLDWTPPRDPPAWRVLRIGYTSTGSTNQSGDPSGLECDKLSRRGLEAHWAGMPAKLLARPLAKDVLKAMLIDSYEVGGQNWTEGFGEEFRRRRGYEITPYLPCVFGYLVGGMAQTARFLSDLQLTVSDLFVENYYRAFSEKCAEHGLESWIEAYGGPFDNLRGMSVATVPMAEFWVGADSGHLPRLAASAARLCGKGIAGAESFTTWQDVTSWCASPRQLRTSGDFAWAEGVNGFVVHTYAHQPQVGVLPGMSYAGHGSHLDRNLTWWPEVRVWTDYVKRGQALLQAGKPRRDILVFGGEATPNNFAREKALSNAGYDYDWASVEGLMRAEAKSYRLIHLGRDRKLSVKVLDRIEGLLDAGAKIAGMRPVSSPRLSDDPARWKQLVERVMPRLIQEGDVLAAVRKAGLAPSVRAVGGASSPCIPKEGFPLSAVVRELGDETVFFVRNPSETAFAGRVSFAAPGSSSAARFHAESGAIEPLALENGTIGLQLPPKGSAFVVFGKKPFAAVGDAPVGDGLEPVLDLSADWRLSDFKGPAAPQEPILLPRLVDWAQCEALKWFSGRATYVREFTWDKAEGRFVLDLGDVREVARVRLNGHDLGVWAYPPLRREISSALVVGVNRLEVEVVNSWANRLIGDACLRKQGAAGDKLTTWTNRPDKISPDAPLPASGLLGPVRILTSPANVSGEPRAGSSPWSGRPRPVLPT